MDDEILHALRGCCVGLNSGRWDYIFSWIKTFRRERARVLPERSQVGMTAPFLKHYSELLIRTCHQRGAFAMGGMAGWPGLRTDPAFDGRCRHRRNFTGATVAMDSPLRQRAR